ncbi:MAG: response regulator transcription factor [Propionibacteriaceae bacterium]|nr:response regulator transcription factor [Propionibacteriaceae bacterium]
MAAVLLVEDDDTLREALVYLLRREGHEVHAAADGQAALDSFARRPPDIILLDLMIPVIDGVEVCRRVRETSSVPIIMVTAKNTEADIVLGLELGADDYITKPFSTPELLARIRSAIRRGRSSAPSGEVAGDDVLVAAGITMDIERHRVSVDGNQLTLPLKEFELLEVLMRNAGRVLTRRQLLNRVWGADYVGDTKTLDVHIRRLRAKIEQNPAMPSRLVTVRGLGYRLGDS